MKTINCHVYITDPVAFARGEFSLHLTDWEVDLTDGVLDWIYAGPLTLNLDIDRKTIVQASMETLDARELEIRAQLQRALTEIEGQRQEIRAIPHLESVEASND